MIVNIADEQRFPLAGMHAHGADEKPAADADCNIAREIHIGHWVHHKRVRVAHLKRDGHRIEKRKVLSNDPAGNGAEQRFRAERPKIFLHRLLHRFTLNVACGDIVFNVGMTHGLVRNRIAKQLAEIKHSYAVFAHRFRKRVVIRLRQRHMRHIVQQHLIKKVRHNLCNFNVRPVQKHGLQLPNLGKLYYESVHMSSSCNVNNGNEY